jgi:LIVCS family branched-chain amino acid:cation transporter
MKPINKSIILSAGMAIFSMLFGAGNVVYPLLVGTQTQDKYILGILGFLISGILFPLMGTLSIMLFEGDYLKFFAKLGKYPGFLITLFIMCLIGPFGATPRIVCIAYGSIKNIFPQLHLISFSLITCLIIFFFTIKKKRFLDVLGYILTPILLGSLLLIICIGLFKISRLTPSNYTYSKALLKGFKDGNQTMDLFGTLCFSSMIYNIFKTKISKKENKKLFSLSLKASIIGLSLLALIYICFIKISAFYGSFLSNLTGAELLTTLTTIILGSKASYVSSIIIALACLTTAIALCRVFTDFFHEKLFKEKIKYSYCLIGFLIVTFLLSTLNFDGITKVLNPILIIIYPAIIVLSCMNILHKLYGFKMIKIPVFLTLIISMFLKLFMSLH